MNKSVGALAALLLATLPGSAGAASPALTIAAESRSMIWNGVAVPAVRYSCPARAGRVRKGRPWLESTARGTFCTTPMPHGIADTKAKTRAMPRDHSGQSILDRRNSAATRSLAAPSWYRSTCALRRSCGSSREVRMSLFPGAMSMTCGSMAISPIRPMRAGPESSS